ncbi:MAG TPA: hypothetical protein VK633_11030 [Verrucomicrobiae bacterium]|nr:hypothetical protein [Verrucomicrobiae bacterium]
MNGELSSRGEGLSASESPNNPLEPLEPLPWSGRRWIYSVATVFLIQVCLLFYVGETKQALPVIQHFKAKIMLAADPYSQQQLARSVPLSDPTAFALANVHGFSGDAWLKFKPLQYQAAGWSAPARWLKLNPDGLGETLFQTVATNVTPPLQLLEGANQNPAGWDIYLPPKSMPTQSELRVEMADDRALLTKFDLPSWPHPDLLSNTVVQVLIDADGFSLSATPLSESGSREADRFATQAAARARFSRVRPLDQSNADRPDEGLTWVRLVFQWHTLPPLATNQTGAPSSAP